MCCCPNRLQADGSPRTVGLGHEDFLEQLIYYYIPRLVKSWKVIRVPKQYNEMHKRYGWVSKFEYIRRLRAPVGAKSFAVMSASSNSLISFWNEYLWNEIFINILRSIFEMKYAKNASDVFENESNCSRFWKGISSFVYIDLH